MRCLDPERLPLHTVRPLVYLLHLNSMLLILYDLWPKVVFPQSLDKEYRGIRGSSPGSWCFPRARKFLVTIQISFCQPGYAGIIRFTVVRKVYNELWSLNSTYLQNNVRRFFCIAVSLAHHHCNGSQ